MHDIQARNLVSIFSIVFQFIHLFIYQSIHLLSQHLSNYPEHVRHAEYCKKAVATEVTRIGVRIVPGVWLIIWCGGEMLVGLYLCIYSILILELGIHDSSWVHRLMSGVCPQSFPQ